MLYTRGLLQLKGCYSSVSVVWNHISKGGPGPSYIVRMLYVLVNTELCSIKMMCECLHICNKDHCDINMIKTLMSQTWTTCTFSISIQVVKGLTNTFRIIVVVKGLMKVEVCNHVLWCLIWSTYILKHYVSVVLAIGQAGTDIGISTLVVKSVNIRLAVSSSI